MGEDPRELPLFERTARPSRCPVCKATRLTVYTRFGDWFPRLLIGLLLVVLVWDLVPKKKARSARFGPTVNDKRQRRR